MLTVTHEVWLQMVGHAYDGLPDEACGLMAGPAAAAAGQTGEHAQVFYPCRNAAASSRVYTVDWRDYDRAERDADARGLTLVGVMHSHTHTEAYPSPTDVENARQAQEALLPADWHYVIVSLMREAPVLRSYRMVDGTIAEEPVGLRG